MYHLDKKFRLDDAVLSSEDTIKADIESRAYLLVDELKPLILAKATEERLNIAHSYNDYCIHVFDNQSLIDERMKKLTNLSQELILDRVCEIINSDNGSKGKCTISWGWKNIKDGKPYTPMDIRMTVEKRLVFEIHIIPSSYEM